MSDPLRIGVDTLCYHCRIETGGITVEDVIRECVDVGADFVQLNTYHIRDRDGAGLLSLRRLADSLDVPLTLAGTRIGLATAGDTVDSGVARLVDWLEVAAALSSPYVRVSSGFYRNELIEAPDRIATEREFVTETLRRAAEVGPHAEIRILLENHSDFTYAEYVRIMEDLANPRLGVFLDVINPVSMLDQPLPVVEALAPYARGGHVKDYRIVSRHVEDGFHRRGFDVQYVYPGEGVADLPALLGVVRQAADAHPETPYWLSIEGLDNYPDVADQARRLATSLAVVREAVGSAPTR